MPQLVYTLINIEGLREGLNGIRAFSSFVLSQGVFEHHSFRLICAAKEISKSAYYPETIEGSINLIGKKIRVSIQSVEGQKISNVNETPAGLTFEGLITQVEAVRDCGDTKDIIISGFSPTILLDDGPNCKTWENKRLEDIVRDLTKTVPGFLPHFRIPPFFGEPLAYTVQYKETSWEFLNRLMISNEFWCYFDGWMDLKFGLNTLEKQKLYYGSSLTHFNLAVQARPSRFQVNGYDYLNHEAYDSKPVNIANEAGLNDLGKIVLQKSEQLYRTCPKQWNNQFLTNKKQLDDFANASAARQSSDMVHFNGTSGHPGLKVGSAVSVQGKNFLNNDEFLGEYVIISIQHYFDGQGNYMNNFIALPASVTVPPANITKPYSETQSALVTDNYDPHNLGRVRVKFHWMDAGERTPWIRIASPHGGKGKGMFFIPEIGEEVIVGFEGDDPENPYIMGTVYHGKANASGIGNDKNDIKQIKTRSGHTLKFDDVENGSITILTPGGHTILLNDKDKSISISGTEHIHLVSKETVSIKSKKVSIHAEEINMNASRYVSLHSDDKVILHGNNSLNGSAKNAEVKAENDLSLKSGKTATMVSETTNVKGSRVNIN